MITIFGWIILFLILKLNIFFLFREWFEEWVYDSRRKEMAKYRQVNKCSNCKMIINSDQRFGRFCPYCHARGDLLFMNVYEAYEDGHGKTKEENEKEQK